MRSTTPHSPRRPSAILADRDPIRIGMWVAALALGAFDMLARPAFAWRAGLDTAGPFLVLGAILVFGAAADRLGVFALLGRVMVPGTPSAVLDVAAVLLFTALLSGLVNLDVAVVVAVPLALTVARRARVSATWLVPAVAVTANATSFLLPTSNITTLLVLSSASRSVQTTTYLRESWVAWLLVTALTVGVLSMVVARRPSESPPDVAAAHGLRLLAVLDLVPMFLAASAIRGLLGLGIVLRGSLLDQLAAGSAFGAAVDNVPAAAALHAIGPTARWAAVLAMSIGPNLLVTGSIATLISRRIARDRGTAFGIRAFMALGTLLVPAQLAAAYLGLRLTGALG